MRARVLYRLSPTAYRLACTLDEDDADGVWRRLQAQPALAGRSMKAGDVIYLADVYYEPNGDGGWRVLEPGVRQNSCTASSRQHRRCTRGVGVATAGRSGERWSAAEVWALLQLASHNLPGSEIAARMSRSYAAIQEKAWSLGAPIGKPRRLRVAWTKADDAQVAELARAGMTRRVAAGPMARDIGTLRSHAKALGLTWQGPPRPERRQRGPANPPRDWPQVAAQLQWLADNGWSAGMAALELDIHTSRAWRLTRDFGIQWKVRFKSTKRAPPPSFKPLPRTGR